MALPGMKARTENETMTQPERLTEIELEISGDDLTGTVVIRIAPGTVATQRDAMIDDVLSKRMREAASQMKVVLAADAHAYAHPQPGLDKHARTVFKVRGRVEGDLLVPVRAGKRRR